MVAPRHGAQDFKSAKGIPLRTGLTIVTMLILSLTGFAKVNSDIVPDDAVEFPEENLPVSIPCKSQAISEVQKLSKAQGYSVEHSDVVEIYKTGVAIKLVVGIGSCDQIRYYNVLASVSGTKNHCRIASVKESISK